MEETADKETADTEKIAKPKRGRFVKGQKPPPGSGRPRGARNKITKTLKEAWEQAFAKLQQDPERNLQAWAMKSRANLRDFYRLSIRLIPPELTLKGSVQVTLPEEDRQARIMEAARGMAFLLMTAEGITGARNETPMLSAPIAQDVADEAMADNATYAAGEEQGVDLARAERLFEREVGGVIAEQRRSPPAAPRRLMDTYTGTRRGGRR